jgi:methyltransferase family protein
MSSPLSRVTTRVVYGASQLPRIAWYIGHGLAVRRLSDWAERRVNKARPRAHTNLPVPDRKRLYADMAILLQQDLANIEAGIYPLPADHDGSLLTLLHRSRLFFEDLPAIPLDFLKQAWPRLPALGLDMSEPYVKYAKRHLKRWSRLNLTVGNAETLPVPDESQDAVTSIFLFHELPPKVRRNVFRECTRVLKPGGRLVLVDSLQCGDQLDYDGLLELFPQNYHEPYYRSYTKEDFGALAAACGLTHIRDVKAFLSKVMVFDKPAVA